ncbi:MAG: helix-turn-helix transcriptional regulator [Sphingopyxis sp.]|nr:helix-turn-helix transcriptional regulator [Sphingopyxis sp.]
MAALDIIDPMIRGGGIALFALWIAILWRDHRAVLAARVAIAMNVTIIAYLLARLFNREGPSQWPYIVFDAAAVMVPSLFWLFARLWFDDREAIGWRSWLLILGFALLPLAQIVLIAATGDYSWEIWAVVRVGMFAFALAGMWIAWRGRMGDLIEARRGFRLGLICAIGGFILLVTFVEMVHNRETGHEMWRAITLAAIFAGTFAVSIGLYRFRAAELFAPPDAAAPPDRVAPSPDVSPLAQRLKAVMAEERAYRAEGFSIAMLAARLGEPEYRVRRAINGEMGFRNFTAFLNSFRLDEVRGALADPAQREVPILTIALDAGFGSLGPFNRAFRDAEGMTPSGYRVKALANGFADSGIG